LFDLNALKAASTPTVNATKKRAPITKFTIYIRLTKFTKLKI
jgi:hypothetical protein